MKSVIQDIKAGKFRRVYLFYGEEMYLKQQYKTKLREAVLPGGDTMNLNVYSGKGTDVQAVIDQAETMPFFAEHRLLIVEDSGLFKSASPQMAEYISRIPDGTVLLFVEDEVDKRGKLYKAVNSNGRTVEFKYQNEQTLTKWILSLLKKEDMQITRQALTLFLEKTGTDMERIRQELEKLICFCMDKRSIEPEDVLAVCNGQTENKIFEMIRALAEQKQKKALELYYDLLALKEPPMRILYLITRQFHILLQVKELRRQGYGEAEIASRMKLAGFAARNHLRQAGFFSEERLREAVQDCILTEEAVKTGKIKDILGVELLLVQYSQKNPSD